MKDRVKELRRVPAHQLRPNGRNWRTHPHEQRAALRGVLAEIGFAGALLARELPDGSLELIDGHLRAETSPDAVLPVLVLDVTAEEADKLLLTHDPLAQMAGVDEVRLGELLASVEFSAPEVEALLSRQADGARFGEGLLERAVGRPEAVIPEAFQVVVQCADEAQQRTVFEQMRKEGYRCRVLTLS